MARTKKISFKLNPEWMFKEPIDFEYNKYTLLDYLQKCESSFEKMEIYPNFVELSLHLANLQSISKENILLLTNKKFLSCDDEILVKDLFSKKPRELSKDEESELDKTIRFSGGKLFDAFNMAKSIWNIAYDSTEIILKKNKKFLNLSNGFIYFYNKLNNEIIVWEYEIKKPKKDKESIKTFVKTIYKETLTDITLLDIISNNSTWSKTKNYNNFPVFEMKCSNNLPMEQTLVPIMKRKLMAFIYQTISVENIATNFDLKK